LRKLEQTSRFRKDAKREARGIYREVMGGDFLKVIDLLLRDELLTDRFADHSLSGKWHGYRDCHIRPDLVLIYSKPDNETLLLARIGTHSQLKF
jgi:mRNA interferase YafQ